jgi:hypothetical protein
LNTYLFDWWIYEIEISKPLFGGIDLPADVAGFFPNGRRACNQLGFPDKALCASVAGWCPNDVPQ